MTFTKVLTYDRTSASFGRLFMSVKRIPFKYLCRFGKGAWWLRFNDKNEQQNVKSTKTFQGTTSPAYVMNCPEMAILDTLSFFTSNSCLETDDDLQYSSTTCTYALERRSLLSLMQVVCVSQGRYLLLMVPTYLA